MFGGNSYYSAKIYKILTGVEDFKTNFNPGMVKR